MPVNAYLVLGVVPANNEQQVPINANITISFAKHMDVDTLHDGNIRLRKVNGDAVSYTYDYSRENFKMIIKPSALLPNTQYQLEILGGTAGVKSVTGDYMSIARTYEFSTIQLKAVSEPRNLVLSQNGKFIKVKWELPAEVNENETITYSVRASTSSDPEAPYLWPKATEGMTTSMELNIPQEFELGTNYYAMVQAKAGEFTSKWVVSQIYMEKPKDPDPGTGGGGGTNPPDPFAQLQVLEVYPTEGSILIGDTVMVVFNDSLDTLPENPMYVVQAPHKAKLSVVDTLTTYAVSKAVPGTVSLVPDHDNILQWKVDKELDKELEFSILLSKELKGKTVGKIGMSMMFGFRSPWKRLYGDINRIKERLSGFISLSDAYIYESMRVNTLNAYEIVSNTSGFNPSEYTDTKAPYFVHEYVNIQSAYDLLLNAITRGSSSGKKESVKLGQLTVDKETDLASMMSLLNKLKSELKPWNDLIHGHHNRGYAKPAQVVKGEAGAPYPDYFTREFKSDFDAK